MMDSSVTQHVVDYADQSHEMTMDDSTTTTVEFLRARLLSERLISKTTRQRANELARKVTQLEEQLNIATLQRKHAEKATSDVLAILESHGISDLSEVCDSCSDQEDIGGVSKKIDGIGVDVGNLTTSRVTEIKDPEPKGLDLGVLSSVNRSLSWKSCSDNRNSHEHSKSLAKPKRQSSFVSTSGSSTKHQIRKSRRQIRQRETRSSEAKLNEESFLLNAQENVVATGDASRCITNITKILQQNPEEEKEYAENSVQCMLEDQRRKGQFEAQENSQRQWEEKFKWNNCNSSDSCEHGNHSDITEERDDTRVETSEAVDTIIEQGGNPGREQLCGSEVVKKDPSIQSVPHPHHDIRYSKDQQHVNSTDDQSQTICAEFSFPSQLHVEAKSSDTQKPEWSAKPHSFHAGGSSDKADSSRNGLQLSSHHVYPNDLGSVLDALQRAKLSLNSLASSTGGGPAVRRTKSLAPSVTSGSAMNMPVGCAGLFKVPTGPEFEAPVKGNSLIYPSSNSNSSRYHPEGRHSASPYLDSSLETGARSPFLDPFMDKQVSLPSSSKYMYPYTDFMPKRSPDGFSRTYPRTGLEKSTEDLYTDYSNQTRFDLYKG